MRLRQQPLVVLRPGVLPRYLGALEAPGPAYGGQGAAFLYAEAASAFDLEQPGAPDANLPARRWRGGQRGEIV